MLAECARIGRTGRPIARVMQMEVVVGLPATVAFFAAASISHNITQTCAHMNTRPDFTGAECAHGLTSVRAQIPFQLCANDADVGRVVWR